MNIERPLIYNHILASLQERPVTALLGPRQCGKTTVARIIAAQGSSTFFDLESPRDWARLDQPLMALESLTGLVVIDEIQRKPELFPILRVLADRPEHPARFLLLGSASLDLIRGASESLAGRVRFLEMGGFLLEETGADSWKQLWLRGGFPKSYLARDSKQAFRWREDFVRTFLEMDMAQLGFRYPAQTLRRFWAMVAHYHGQTWNASEIGASLGSTFGTMKRYLDALVGTYVLRALPPWFSNMGKRVVKSPKVFVRDTGLLHYLLGISEMEELMANPKLGASWEGFVLEQILSKIGDRDAWFYATQAGAELDLFLHRGNKRIGIEVKFQDAPRITKSMGIVMEDLKLDHLWVVYPGKDRFLLRGKIEAIGLQEVLKELGSWAAL